MAENAFQYETQGTNTYFVYTIQPGDSIDTMALGMLTNNKIPGLAATQFTQMDTERYIKFNVSAKVPVSQFFSGAVNRRRLVGVFKGITSALLSAEEYMIDPGSIMLDLDYIFADVSTCETVLLCLPIERAQTQADLGQFFKNIVFTTQFDSTENSDYVVRIMNYLNSTPMFSLENFASLLDQLDKRESGSAVPAKSEAALVQSVQQQAAQTPQPVVQAPPTPAQPQPAQQPARQPMQTPPAMQPNRPANLPPQNFAAPPQQPMQAPAAQSGEKQSFFKRLFGSDKEAKAQKEAAKAAKKGGAVQPGAPMAAPPQQGFAPQAGQGYPQQPAAFPQQPQKGKKDKKKNQAAPAGFAVPGQQQGFPVPGQQPGQQPNAAAQGQRPARQQGFAVPGQEQNFVTPGNRKAAAKAAAKQQAAAPQPGFPPQAAQQGYRPQNIPQPNFPSQAVPQPQQAGFQAPQSGAPAQQAVPQVQQPAPQPQTFTPPQPGPAQGQPMNFGETTVLGGNSLGETTVLGAVTQEQIVKPHLIRAKNNEQISVDKPVFRIGKERSYVDYFVGDNPAISRSHANIIARDGVYFIMDTNSTNHTYVNGGMIQSNSEVKISHGTKIRLANEEFEFRLY